MPWPYPIDWTATAALAALILSGGQILVSVWAVRRAERATAAQAIMAQQLRETDIRRARADRRQVIEHTAQTIESAARELCDAIIPLSGYARLSEFTQGGIAAAVHTVSAVRQSTAQVDAGSSMLLARTEQILARVREIVPHNEHVRPSSRDRVVELLTGQAAMVREILAEFDKSP